MNTYTFTPIGFLESIFKDKFGTPRQPGLVAEARARLKLRTDLQPEECLSGLKACSHLWLIFVFHQNQTARYHPKVHPPRLGGKSTGLFATRSPHRPNPIGLSLVELEEIQEDYSLILRGVDLIHGTPILDIKPYLKEIECLPQAKSNWMEDLNQFANNIEWKITYSDQAQNELIIWQQNSLGVNCKTLVEQCLQLDPRPLVYRGYEGRQDAPYRQEHVIRLENRDVFFRYISGDQIEVFKISTVLE